MSPIHQHRNRLYVNQVIHDLQVPGAVNSEIHDISPFKELIEPFFVLGLREILTCHLELTFVIDRRHHVVLNI